MDWTGLVSFATSIRRDRNRELRQNNHENSSGYSGSYILYVRLSLVVWLQVLALVFLRLVALILLQ